MATGDSFPRFLSRIDMPWGAMYDDEPPQRPVMARDLAPLTAELVSVREHVESGSLRLNPEAGERIRAMLRKQMDDVDGWLERARGLTQRPPLGLNPVGETVAGTYESRAGGEDDTSFIAVFASYRQSLQDTDDTVREAVQKYHEADDRNAERFKRLAQ
ncbi:hypothetical protein GCM10029964_079670 [Kibdelosporangium lantanae]